MLLEESLVAVVVATGESAASGGSCTTAGLGTSTGVSTSVGCAIEVEERVLVEELEVLVTVTKEELVVLVETLVSAAAALTALVFFAAVLELLAVDLGIAVHFFPLIVVKKAPTGSAEDVDMVGGIQALSQPPKIPKREKKKAYISCSWRFQSPASRLEREWEIHRDVKFVRRG